jgi:release factor glutamine methyltransferase
MTTVAERLADARERLEAAGIPAADAPLDVEVLARHALGWDRARLLVHAHENEPPDFASTFAGLISRRAEREPVAQIVGVREFWERDFEVTADVLIPRPETEIIIEEALAFAREQTCARVIDVGTGSGCLAVTLACELPDVHIVATDVSAAALAVATRNARRYHVEDRVTLIRSDVLAGVTGMADLIVSNPPYVPEADASAMQPEVLRYEPHVALFGGATGLEVMRRLFVQARDRLADHGRLVVEFGFGQDAGVSDLAHETGWRVERIREDLQGIPRTGVLSRASGGRRRDG